MTLPKPPLVPSFAPSGDRDRWYSVEACLHYESISKAVLKRNRKGTILAMLFRDDAASHPLRATMKPGQRYSFLGHIGDSRLWQHSRITIDGNAADFQRSCLDVSDVLSVEEAA